MSARSSISSWASPGPLAGAARRRLAASVDEAVERAGRIRVLLVAHTYVSAPEALAVSPSPYK